MKEELIKKFYELCKTNNLKPNDKEAKDAVRTLCEDLLTTKTESRYFGKDYSLEDQDYKDFAKFQEHLVQESIDFINSHPGIKEKIEQKRKELSEEWMSEGFLSVPDTRLYFGVDGLEDSLKDGNWVPSTDSCLDLCVGGVSVLTVM